MYATPSIKELLSAGPCNSLICPWMFNLPQVSYTIIGFSPFTCLIATQSSKFPIFRFIQIAVILNQLKISQVLWGRNSILLAEVPSWTTSEAAGSRNHTSQNLFLAMTWPSTLGNAEPAAGSCKENKTESSLADGTFQGCFSHPCHSIHEQDSCFASWKQKSPLRGEKKIPKPKPKAFCYPHTTQHPRCPLLLFAKLIHSLLLAKGIIRFMSKNSQVIKGLNCMLYISF